MGDLLGNAGNELTTADHLRFRINRNQERQYLWEIPAASQIGTIPSSGQHRLKMPPPLRIGGQSVRCQIHCETCQLY